MFVNVIFCNQWFEGFGLTHAVCVCEFWMLSMLLTGDLQYKLIWITHVAQYGFAQSNFGFLVILNCETL